MFLLILTALLLFVITISPGNGGRAWVWDCVSAKMAQSGCQFPAVSRFSGAGGEAEQEKMVLDEATPHLCPFFWLKEPHRSHDQELGGWGEETERAAKIRASIKYNCVSTHKNNMAFEFHQACSNLPRCLGAVCLWANCFISPSLSLSILMFTELLPYMYSSCMRVINILVYVCHCSTSTGLVNKF